MSETKKTAFIGAKVEPSLAKKAKDAAWRKRQTLSEFLRIAIVQELKRRYSGTSEGGHSTMQTARRKLDGDCSPEERG